MLETKEIFTPGAKFGPFVVLGRAFRVKAGRYRPWHVVVRDGSDAMVVRVSTVMAAAEGRLRVCWAKLCPKLYGVWRGMISRTEVSSCSGWKYYGARLPRLAAQLPHVPRLGVAARVQPRPDRGPPLARQRVLPLELPLYLPVG